MREVVNSVDETHIRNASKESLIMKLATIRQNLKYTEKRGTNNFHHYDYVMAADIAAGMGKTLADAGIILTREGLKVTYEQVANAKGEAETEARIEVTYVLHDADSDATLRYESAGAGRDKGDKAIYKAWTGCLKYFCIQAFLMPIGDDPEDDRRGNARQQPEPEPEAGPMTDEQCQEIVRLIGMANVEVKKVLDGYKVDAIKNLPYEKVKKALGAKLRKGPCKAALNEVASYPAVPPEA